MNTKDIVARIESAWKTMLPALASELDPDVGLIARHFNRDTDHSWGRACPVCMEIEMETTVFSGSDF